jgi:hypothetical protein
MVIAFKTGLRRGKVTSGEQRGDTYRIFPHPQLSTKGKEQVMKLQIELAGLSCDKEVNPQQVKEVFVKEAEAKAEMFLTSLDYLRKLKGVLNQEQLKKLEAQGL